MPAHVEADYVEVLAERRHLGLPQAVIRADGVAQEEGRGAPIPISPPRQSATVRRDGLEHLPPDRDLAGVSPAIEAGSTSRRRRPCATASRARARTSQPSRTGQPR